MDDEQTIGILRLYPGTAEHIDGLCTSCWCATLWQVEMVTLTEDGVTPVTIWTGCVACPATGELRRP